MKQRVMTTFDDKTKIVECLKNHALLFDVDGEAISYIYGWDDDRVVRTVGGTVCKSAVAERRIQTFGLLLYSQRGEGRTNNKARLETVESHILELEELVNRLSEDLIESNCRINELALALEKDPLISSTPSSASTRLGT
jgi:hypothetical protein